MHTILEYGVRLRRTCSCGTRRPPVERYMGPILAQRAVPSRWLVDTLGFEGTAAGTDNQVNTLNPFVGLYIMVTRKDPTGRVFGADQALTRQEALRLYTNAGPYYTFEERKKGSIEVGKFADMVVLSADYLTVRTTTWRGLLARWHLSAMQMLTGCRSPATASEASWWHWLSGARYIATRARRSAGAKSRRWTAPPRGSGGGPMRAAG